MIFQPRTSALSLCSLFTLIKGDKADLYLQQHHSLEYMNMKVMFVNIHLHVLEP